MGSDAVVAERIEPLPAANLEAELQRLVDLYFSAYQAIPEYAYETRPEVEDYLRWLFRGDPAGLFVARKGAEIGGWCSVDGNWRGWRGELAEPIAEIQELVVAGSWQGRGIGQRFVVAALQHAVSAGRSVAGLWVGEHNERAKRLYLRNGFSEQSRWKIWIRMTRSDLIAFIPA